MYYFQFTLTPYGKDIETTLPSKTPERLPTFKQLSSMIGANRVIWWYDPILINEKYSVKYHLYAFAHISKELQSFTKKVVISFIDTHYQNVKSNLSTLALKDFEEEQRVGFVRKLVEIAAHYDLVVESCSQKLDL
jgi:hypothetical protein